MSRKNPPPIPSFSTPIIETHCHLDYLDSEGLDTCLAEAAAAGVERIVTIAVSPDNLNTVLDISNRYENVWATQGIHPHEASQWNAEVAVGVRAGAGHAKVVAIGEIGLDYYYEHSDRPAQLAAFEAQLQIACDLDLPVVIHTREADEDTQSILANFSSLLPKKGVIHSFTSSLALAEFCLGEGFALGFNGIATFNRADNVREVVAATPLNQLLLETDAPYLTPVPYRGRPNAPKYLPFIAQSIAQTKGTEIEELLAQAHENSLRTFF